MHQEGEITTLLAAASSGDENAAAKLGPLIYQELRVIARQRLSGAGAGETLSTTALVHEAWLRLVGNDAEFPNRGHFYSYAASAMRSIVIDHARRRLADRRGGGMMMVSLDEQLLDQRITPDRVLALDQALTQLSSFESRLGQLVEWRVFGGLELAEIAPLLGVGERTIKRDWRKARAFLAHLLDASSLGAEAGQ